MKYSVYIIIYNNYYLINKQFINKKEFTIYYMWTFSILFINNIINIKWKNWYSQLLSIVIHILAKFFGNLQSSFGSNSGCPIFRVIHFLRKLIIIHYILLVIKYNLIYYKINEKPKKILIFIKILKINKIKN